MYVNGDKSNSFINVPNTCENIYYSTQVITKLSIKGRTECIEVNEDTEILNDFMIGVNYNCFMKCLHSSINRKFGCLTINTEKISNILLCDFSALRNNKLCLYENNKIDELFIDDDKRCK